MSDAQTRPALTCAECGAILDTARQEHGRICLDCFDRRLRGLDADFLDNFGRLGARKHIILAEATLKALVLSDTADRKLLAISIYEQFVASAADLLAVYHALIERERRPIMRGVLAFQLDRARVLDFFARLSVEGPREMLDAAGLPHAEQIAGLQLGIDARERRQLQAALIDALADLERLVAFEEVGERALVGAAERLAAPMPVVAQTEWLEGRGIEPDQVAALALGAGGRRLEVNVLSTDEQTLGNVVDGIEVMTRLVRNLIFAYVSLHPDGAPHDAWRRG
ncbi:MAG TPA: hypothetical protein VKV26_15135 [Dehalococcoidia bacterium]|nr:hypothetical protein [Dehalococcoidia bacterium]